MNSDLPAFDKPLYSLSAFAQAATGVITVGPSLARVYLRHSIAPAFRERIWVALSAANACRYCSFVHRDWAGRVGVSESEIEELAHLDFSPLERQAQIAVEYLLTWVSRQFKAPEPGISQAFEAVFTPALRDDLRATARLCTLANLTGNTFDALLSRLRRNPAPGSRALDELVISAFFLAGAATVVPGLLWTHKESPVALFAHFRSFTQRFAGPPI